MYNLNVRHFFCMHVLSLTCCPIPYMLYIFIYGRRIPTQKQREQNALGIVRFPSLKDPFSKKGYVRLSMKLLNVFT